MTTKREIGNKVMTHVDDYLEVDDRVFHVFDEDDVATQVVTYSDVIEMMHELIEKILTESD